MGTPELGCPCRRLKLEFQFTDLHGVPWFGSRSSSALSTPSRRSRSAAMAAAAGTVRSAKATARIAARPSTSQPGPSLVTTKPCSTGRCSKNPGRSGDTRLSFLDEFGNPVKKFGEAGAGLVADSPMAPGMEPRACAPSAKSIFPNHHLTGTLEQVRLVLLQLAQQDLQLLSRRMFLEGRGIEQDHQRPGALDVTQELVSEPLARGGSLDQPGDI